ncbi:sialate O-acetylesterase [Rubinisphaera italica]|nr:sialate O-acetylesterase [Rubinisphaera italica]
MMRNTTILIAAIAALFSSDARGADKPVKVYILAGQSNMEGQAKVETFDYIGEDPATAPLLKEMRGPDGKPRVCKRVWISYLTGSPDRGLLGEGFGKLTAGYGSRSNPAEDGGKIGPEFTFGLTMEKAYDGPILIIKTAWGGKSLNTDFRPPSAGTYGFNENQLENFRRQGKDIEQIKADKEKASGRYYRLMIDHVKNVLANPKRVMPDYDANTGYKIAGFVWFQGWNDMVDSGTYPERGKAGVGYPKYSEWMADFIRDVRKDLAAPKMPFVIGVLGVGGPIGEDYSPRYKVTHQNFRDAMAAPASLPEFKGNVAAVRTELYWDQPLAAIEAKLGEVRNMARQLKNKAKGSANEDGSMTPTQQREYVAEYRAKLISAKEEAMWESGASNGGYHYLGCAKTMALIGKAFAEAIVDME